MGTLRRVGWLPLVGIVLIIAVTGVILFAPSDWVRVVAAVATATSLVLGVGSWASNHYPRIYFAKLAIQARLRRASAPAWRLRVTLRSAVDRQDLRSVQDALTAAGTVAHTDGYEVVTVEDGDARVELRWEGPLDDPDAPDGQPLTWLVHATFSQQAVPYHESIHHLRQRVMPLLEAVERAIRAMDRTYHLVVKYGPGGNPFEGLLIRSVPGDELESYEVVFRPVPGEPDLIRLSIDQLVLDSPTRSRFEATTERLLTLNGSWRGGLGLLRD